MAKYNDGYGIFDTKNYDSDIAMQVLSGMTEEGIKVFKTFYWIDMAYIIFLDYFTVMFP